MVTYSSWQTGHIYIQTCCAPLKLMLMFIGSHYNVIMHLGRFGQVNIEITFLDKNNILLELYRFG